MTISVGGSIVLSGAGLILQAMGYRLADPHPVVLFGVGFALVVRGTVLSIRLGLVWVLVVEAVIRP